VSNRSEVKMKKCSMCGLDQPETAFYSLKGDRLQYYCKTCSKRYRDAYKLGMRRMSLKKKECEKCGEIKSKSQFYESRLTYDQLFEWCKDCCTTHTSKNRTKEHYADYMTTERGV